MKVKTEEMTWNVRPQSKRLKVAAPHLRDTTAASTRLPEEVSEVKKLQMPDSTQLAAKKKEQTSKTDSKPPPQSHTDVIDVEKVGAFHWQSGPQSKRLKVAAPHLHDTTAVSTRLPEEVSEVKKLQMPDSTQLAAKKKEQTSKTDSKPPPQSHTDVIDVEKVWAFHWQSVPTEPHPQVALVIQKHWCDQILDGNKNWEIRGHYLNRRGRICIAQSRSRSLVGEVTQ